MTPNIAKTYRNSYEKLRKNPKKSIWKEVQF